MNYDKEACTCEFCQLEFPSPRFVQRHEKHCLVRLRRISPATAQHGWLTFLERKRAQAVAIAAKRQAQP